MHSNCLTFSLLSGLKHISTTRCGGASTTPFESLNLGDGLGDDEALVALNRQRVTEHLGVKRLVYGQQVHGIHLHEVTPTSPETIRGCDGFILRHPKTAAMVKHADCQAAIFYDPRRRVAAVVHAGWRGLVQNIYALTVKVIGSRPEELLVAIAPSLGPEASEFTNYRTEFPESFWKFQVKPNYFDLWTIAESQLIASGLLPHHIEVSRLSTYSHPEDFFSYRRAKTTGRQGTLVAL